MIKFHVGLIPDGSRRWAAKHGILLCDAYIVAVERIIEIIENIYDCGVTSLSIYLLSKENLTRSRNELEAVFRALLVFTMDLLPSTAMQHRINVVHAGDKALLPNALNIAISELSGMNTKYSSRHLYLLIGYNPFDEIKTAIKHYSVDSFSIDKLWVPEPLDLIIRSAGGPALLSNFLPLQAGYAQIKMLEDPATMITWHEIKAVIESGMDTKMPYGQ
jgi:undecaprenyl diphosphate synthase